MASQELSIIKKVIFKESILLYNRVCKIGAKGNFQEILEAVISFRIIVESFMEDKFTKMPSNVLNLIFSGCEMVDLITLGRSCKRFYGLVFNERFSKLQTQFIWGRVAAPRWDFHSFLAFADKKEEYLKEVPWKTLLYQLRNRNRNGYACTIKTEHSGKNDDSVDDKGADIITLGYFAEGELRSDAIRIVLDENGIGFQKGEYLINGHGKGLEYLASGEEYHGDFLDYKYHGRGTYTWKSGSKHIGSYRFGDKNGIGKVTYSNGSQYEGNYQHDHFHGQGDLIKIIYRQNDMA